MAVLAFLAGFGAWSWLVAGLVLLGLELLAPGGIFIWLGAAGIATGLIGFIFPLDWPHQFGLFGLLGILAILAWLRFVRGRSTISDRPLLNQRAERLVGLEVVLDEPISGGFGRVPLGDGVWRVAGPDLAAGRKVRIVGHEGTLLNVVDAGAP